MALSVSVDARIRTASRLSPPVTCEKEQPVAQAALLCLHPLFLPLPLLVVIVVVVVVIGTGSRSVGLRVVLSLQHVQLASQGQVVLPQIFHVPLQLDLTRGSACDTSQLLPCLFGRSHRKLVRELVVT